MNNFNNIINDETSSTGSDDMIDHDTLDLTECLIIIYYTKRK